MPNLFVVRTSEELKKCFPVIKELRPHLTYDSYISIYENARKADGYEMVGLEENNHVLAAMGYRVLFDFVRGKYLYIDDLVSTEASRSKGLGGQLLKYAEGVAQKLDCGTLRLCTGIENEGGIRFYDKNGWIKRSYAYTKKLSK